MNLVDKKDMLKLQIGEVMPGGFCDECKVKYLVKRIKNDVWTLMCTCQFHYISSRGFIRTRPLDKEEYEEFKKWKESTKN